MNINEEHFLGHSLFGIGGPLSKSPLDYISSHYTRNYLMQSVGHFGQVVHLKAATEVGVKPDKALLQSTPRLKRRSISFIPGK